MSEDIVKKEMIPSAINSLPYPNITEGSNVSFSPSQLDHLADLTTGSFRASLDSIAPVKKKTRQDSVHGIISILAS